MPSTAIIALILNVAPFACSSTALMPVSSSTSTTAWTGKLVMIRNTEPTINSGIE